MRNIWLWTFSIIGLFAGKGQAAEFAPWTERDFEIYPRLNYVLLHYDEIETESGTKHRSDNAQFFTLGVSGSYSVWSVDLEASLSETRHQSFGFEDLRLTGRYQWLNDIVGDSVSLMSGVTLIKAAKQTVKDLSTFHHGRNEAEFHIAIGRECPCFATWTSRWWGVAAVGVGDHGSPWLRGDLCWEKHFIPNIRWRVFVDTLWGLGGNGLDLSKPFHGYGSIDHRSVDIGTRLTYQTECSGWWIAEYAYRPYAKNYPKNSHRGMLRFVYPFGL